MVINVTHALEEFEGLVKEGKIELFWVYVHNNRLRLKAAHSSIERIIPLNEDLNEALLAFFTGIERIEYRSHDYTSLKSLVIAQML